LNIIKPGQERLSDKQIKEIAQKQEMLLVLSKWSTFLKAKTTEEILNSEVGKTILENIENFANYYPNANITEDSKKETILKLHSGALIINKEGLHLQQEVKLHGGNIPNEAILMNVAKIISLCQGIVLNDPQVIGDPFFRAVYLAIELGFMRIEETENNNSLIE